MNKARVINALAMMMLSGNMNTSSEDSYQSNYTKTKYKGMSNAELKQVKKRRGKR